MKVKVWTVVSILCGIAFLYSCESYVVNEDFNQVISSKDLPFQLKVLDDDDHNFSIEKLDDNILVQVEDEFSASSGAIKISPNKSYKIEVRLRNNSSDPLILCSFWKSVISQSRQFVISGKNGNPPSSETQLKSNEWQTYQETFTTKQAEDFMVIRLLSNKGQFTINKISIERVN